MELRSSRSRSKTPFTSVESFDKEIIEQGSHVEKVVSRSTRRTTYKIHEGATSSTDEVTSYAVKPSRRSLRSEKTIRQVYKTSDYSSDDGDNEVSSTRTISQNDKNQLIEDAKAAANGSSEVSALNLYKKSGRYWDLYPKTDWTYSHHSRDRVELAPGVVAMPNMSRKTIHSVHDDMGVNFEHKETNTEAYLSKMSTQSADAEYSGSYLRRRLFNNNRYDQHQKSIYRRTVWSRITSSVLTVLTVTTTIFTYMFHTHVSWFSKLHKLSSKVMVMDTWLLWKNPANKSRNLVALCLVPLFLLAGWWALSSLGAALYGAYLNSTTTVHSPDAESLVRKDIVFDVPSIQVSETATSISSQLSGEHIEVITKSFKESLNIEDQLNVDNLVQQILANPSFQSIVNNYNNVHNYEKSSDVDKIEDQQKVIDNLKIEVEKLKLDMVDAEKKRLEEINSILTEFKTVNSHQNAYLTYQLNRCCRKPLINIEGYVSKILSNLLNDVEFLKSQRGFEDYLHSILVARKDLESELFNLTSNLNSKYESLIENNGKLLMDEISRKIKLEINENKEMKANIAASSQGSAVYISDEHIKKVVKDVLAIYDADKTGLVDYAMETMGGQVLTTRCTENYHHGKAVVSVLGIPLWYPVNSPRTIITPSINPGECWAFQNFPGFVVIRLSSLVKIEAFSLEHISKLLVPNGKIDSAPKHFEVYGLTEENDKQPVKLGDYEYDVDGDPLQFFDVEGEDRVFGVVELRVISNHGNPSYTCLYRFRVHGKMSEL